ncbi:glycosyltransferase [Leptobacterium flavescens]|uniref:Glycosyltransferase n=1 Tax=Leptobacterium flavescens TaxID=472055 RepID=A0A6P0ULH7_9FLAO|nr:glycosyltransferase family 2 protein [Leptobacterium flavescens]NER13372.1 glycosyltransferase [Leptobacterium flavescens]
MRFAIVILNWNGKQLLEQFLPSVIAHSEGADIYVADNASTDDSVAFIREQYPQVKIVQNKENGGYAKGYNDALQHIDTDVYCLLNSDVEVTEGWLDPINTAFESNRNIAIIQPKILDYKRKEYFEYAGAAGGFIDLFGYPFCRGRVFQSLEKDEGQYDDTIDIFWASGACLFVRSIVFWELCGFDEEYFAHQEEIDFCWRVKNQDYKILYVGSSKVYHVGGATLSNMNPQKTFLNFRNSLFSITKNLPKRKVFPILFARLVLDGIAGLRFILQFKFGHFFAILKAHFSFYLRLKRIFKKRGVIPKRKKYFSKTSIVWSYFVLNEKKFNNLIKD